MEWELVRSDVGENDEILTLAAPIQGGVLLRTQRTVWNGGSRNVVAASEAMLFLSGMSMEGLGCRRAIK